MDMIDKIKNRIFEFFIKSNDFNGIPLRQISEEFNIDYKESIELIKKLVSDDSISIQSSTNPHIIGFQHFSIGSQLNVLEHAKDITQTVLKSDAKVSFRLVVENTEFPICLYPSPNYLKTHRDLSVFGDEHYSKRLALGEPRLKPVFFDIDVLERYASDPRFDFDFNDYSGKISCHYDEVDNPIVREEDQVFVKTFGLGFDSYDNRVAVVYLRYLKDLTPEHQIYWRSKEVKDGDCRMVEEYYENTIEGNLVFSHSVFSAFLGELEALNGLVKKIFRQELFRETFKEEKRPRGFTFFFSPTLKNYNDFILLIDKMISENINKDFFADRVELLDVVNHKDGTIEKKPKGTLRLFEEWMTTQYTPKGDEAKEQFRTIFEPFKKIRKERQSPAHKIDANNFDKKYIQLQRDIINDAYNSIHLLRHIFQRHKKAKGFKAPEWLDNGVIKTF
jgi:hypothetical protein